MARQWQRSAAGPDKRGDVLQLTEEVCWPVAIRDEAAAQLEEENSKLKQTVADLWMNNAVLSGCAVKRAVRLGASVSLSTRCKVTGLDQAGLLCSSDQSRTLLCKWKRGDQAAREHHEGHIRQTASAAAPAVYKFGWRGLAEG